MHHPGKFLRPRRTVNTLRRDTLGVTRRLCVLPQTHDRGFSSYPLYSILDQASRSALPHRRAFLTAFALSSPRQVLVFIVERFVPGAPFRSFFATHDPARTGLLRASRRPAAFPLFPPPCSSALLPSRGSRHRCDPLLLVIICL